MSNVSDFVGLSKKKAQDVSERRNLIFRLIRADNELFFPYPEDAREDRVCIELDNGVVTKAIIR